MTELSMLLAIFLGLVGLLHLSWALGSTWPRKSERELARTVVGARGIEQMPPRLASLAVSLCLFGAAAWALILREIGPVAPPRLIVLAGGLALASVFLARGLIGVLPYFERIAPEQPFLRLNRRVYSPLSVLVGIAYLLLVAAWPDWSWRLGLREP